MSRDEPGLLGNLPRTRPGRRSDKRPAEPAEPPSAGPPPRRERDADSVGTALRVAGRAAEAGVRIANGVTRGVLRRLPRR